MDDKFFLKSKTIIGAILIALATVAPMFGIDFKSEDANTIMANLDSIMQGVGLILVVWGRVAASGGLTTKTKGSTDKTNSPWAVALIAVVMLLGGCSTTSLEGKTPLEALTLSFDAAKQNFELYKLLPPCSDQVVGLCSKADIIVKIEEYVLVVQGYIDLANATGVDQATTNDAISNAQNALRALVIIYATQALTKA